jgi:superfamily II DNA helicase RecQ
VAQLGFAAGRLHSGVEPSDQWAAAARWMAGGPQFLFVSPERLRSEGLRACLKAMPPRLIVVDEAHWSCPGFVEPPDKMDLRHQEKFDGISKFRQIS